MISLFNNILQITLLSSILMGAVMIIRKLFSKKINIKVLVLLWLMVLVRLIIPFSFETSVNIGEIIPNFNPNFLTSENTIIPENVNIDNTINLDTNIPTETEAKSDTASASVNNEYVAPASENTALKLSQLNLTLILAYVWLLGVIITLLNKSIKMYMFSKMISLSKEVQNDKVLLMLKQNKLLIRLKRKVKIYECDYIDAPLTCGVLRPKILIPVGFIGNLNDNQQNMIILHELYHIKNLDVLKNYLWLAAKIIYWFNPLINFVYKAYIEDTELCCDTMVLNTYPIDQRQQYSQSLIDITKLSKGEMILPVALSFCEDKSTLRKRVEYMIKPTKKLRTLSIVILIIALLFVTLCFTTACLPNAKAYEIIFSDEVIHVEYEIDSEENVLVTVNADVKYPENDTMPIIGIEPTNITAKQFRTFVDYVLEDTPVYYDNPYYIDAEHSHGDLFDGTVVPLGEYRSTHTELYAYTNDEKKSYLQLEQSPSGQGSTLTYWRYDDGRHWNNVSLYQNKDLENMDKSYDECLQIAKDLVDELAEKNNNFELYDTHVYTSDTIKPAYSFYFRRQYGGIHSAVLSGNVYEKDPNYYNILPSETIHVIVDDEGIFEVNWSYQNEQTEIIEQNAQLLSFDEIMDKFNEYCTSNEDWYNYYIAYGETVKTAEIEIDSIQLMYLPITLYTEIDNTENTVILPYELTPVWNFTGDVTFNMESGKSIKLRYSQINIIAVDETTYK